MPSYKGFGVTAPYTVQQLKFKTDLGQNRSRFCKTEDVFRF